MKELEQDDISEICTRSGILISDSTLGIGRQLSYADILIRTIVVHFDESDFPDKVKESISSIIEVDNYWIVLNRYGQLQANEFSKYEAFSILQFLIGSYPKIQREEKEMISIFWAKPESCLFRMTIVC